MIYNHLKMHNQLVYQLIKKLRCLEDQLIPIFNLTKIYNMLFPMLKSVFNQHWPTGRHKLLEESSYFNLFKFMNHD